MTGGPIKLNVGCGLDAVEGYVNIDNSPSLLIQRGSILRFLVNLAERQLGRPLYTRFPNNVKSWDVRRGLPYADETVEVVYSSHLLEHLSRRDAGFFLREAYRVLKRGGVLRLCLPDLERRARAYLRQIEQLRSQNMGIVPADEFMQTTLLGIEELGTIFRPLALYRTIFARERHFWMWDALSVTIVLRKIGFNEVHEPDFRKSDIPEIGLLDLETRKDESFYVEARK